MWTSFLLGLGAGIAATPHCLGMCGGFPLHLAKSTAIGSLLTRQLLFVIGKTFTYVFLGALASALGIIVFRNTQLTAFAPIARLTAGIITLTIGLLMLGFRLPPIKALQGISDAGFVRTLFGGLLDSPGPLASFVLGLGVGYLPCPLPMGMLAVATTSHDILDGMALLAGVGIGTVPGLLAVGLFGAGLNMRFAKYGMKTAGLVVVAIALMTIGRATGLIHRDSPANAVVPSCCQEHRQ